MGVPGSGSEPTISPAYAAAGTDGYGLGFGPGGHDGRPGPNWLPSAARRNQSHPQHLMLHLGAVRFGVQERNKAISDAAIEVFKSASIQSRFLTLTHEDVGRLESLAKQVKEVLDRGVARDETPEC